MQIVETYSHLNGYEYLKVHKPALWDELCDAIADVNAEDCKTKVSKEARKKGEILYAPKKMNDALKINLEQKGWSGERSAHWVTGDAKLIRRTLQLLESEQKAEIIAAGAEAFYSYNQTDFVKDRVAIEVQFGKYAFVAYDLFVKHMAFYVGDKIDVGIEVLPMKSLQSQMSSGPSYYEGQLYNLIREGRGVPAVPLVIVGIAP